MKFEDQRKFEEAYLNLHAVAGGTHQAEGSISFIEDGLKRSLATPKSKEQETTMSEAEIIKQASFYGVTPEKFKAQLAKGWKPAFKLVT